MRVVLVGSGAGLEELVRRMVGPGAEIVRLAPGVTADLVIVEAREAGVRALARIREALPDAPVVVVPSASPVSGRLRLQMTPADIARLTYRQVAQRFGRDVVGDYLTALLRRHEGNVTKAALAAGLERESLHRLMRKFRVKAETFRPSGTPDV